MSKRTSGKHILVLGASSEMAQVFIRQLFQQWDNSHFYLLARHTDAIENLEKEGQQRAHTVKRIHYDLQQPTDLHIEGIEYCVVYAGWLPDSPDAVEKSMLLNFTGIQLFVDNLVKNNALTLQHIVITGSLAGVWHQPHNRAYGLAKTALHHYTIRLQQQLAGTTAVTLVIPGYVRTRMIAHKHTPRLLTISTQEMATKYIHWLNTRPKVVYSQSVWKFIASAVLLLQRLKH